ncbi:MAG: 30S ribosomal protein S15 [Euryarchaeota archaeon]|nr:30S ribosomal protein S15 [Euryarchaeota archaeon]
MATMHTRKRGKSGSTRPYRSKAPDWVEIKKDELEKLIVSLAKKGTPPSEIGIILRDQYGVPLSRYVTGERIVQTLERHGIKPEIPEDLMNLIKKAVNLKKHLDENKGDMVSKRGLQLTEAKIRRLAKYYIREKRLPADWKYDLKKAKLLVK